MSAQTHTAQRHGETARILLFERPTRKHAEQVAHELTARYVLPTPERIAEYVLTGYGIQPLSVRTGEQIANLITEAVKLARA